MSATYHNLPGSLNSFQIFHSQLVKCICKKIAIINVWCCDILTNQTLNFSINNHLTSSICVLFHLSSSKFLGLFGRLFVFLSFFLSFLDFSSFLIEFVLLLMLVARSYLGFLDSVFWTMNAGVGEPKRRKKGENLESVSLCYFILIIFFTSYSLTDDDFVDNYGKGSKTFESKIEYIIYQKLGFDLQ